MGGREGFTGKVSLKNEKVGERDRQRKQEKEEAE
jgi:hypothetical protein